MGTDKQWEILILNKCWKWLKVRLLSKFIFALIKTQKNWWENFISCGKFGKADTRYYDGRCVLLYSYNFQDKYIIMFVSLFSCLLL